MKVWLFVSELTFVPGNYDQFLQELATDNRIIGCTIIKNNSWVFKLKAVVLLLTGFASRLGWQLLKNSHPQSLERKKNIFLQAHKLVHVTDNPHDEASIALLKKSNIDLIVNARTRSFFKKTLLQLPTQGCLNIHHGLLPDQRGLMCDFWGLYHDQDSGFSIHQMTSKLDAGNILWKQVTPPHPLGYLAQTAASAQTEALAIKSILDRIHRQDLKTEENNSSAETKYYSNPGLKDFLLFFLKGKRL